MATEELARTQLAVEYALLEPGNALSRNVVIEIADGVIVGVSSGAATVGSGSEVLRGILIPGLIDSHVHLGFTGGAQPESVMTKGSEAQLRGLIRRRAHAVVRGGVTSVRDLGCRGEVLGEEVRSWGVDHRYPNVTYANQAITVPGGHCDYLASTCVNDEEIRAAISAHAAAEATVLKVMLTGGFMHPEGDAPFRPVYTQEQMNRLVSVAHGLGMSVAVHAHGVDGIRSAILAGADTVEHASFAVPGGVRLERPVLENFSSSGACAVPTVSSLWEVDLPWASRRDAIGVISELHRSGIPVALGTDLGIAGVHPGDHVAGLHVLREAGLSGEEVLAAATTVGARVLRQVGQLGEIRVGASADLVLLRADPREALDTLSDPVAVFRRGQRLLVPGS